jgi:hypothetical protein
MSDPIDYLSEYLEDYELLENKDEDRDSVDFDKAIELPTHGACVLTFKNGKKLYFSTSEWASIATLKDRT